jgi:hypothetical protein
MPFRSVVQGAADSFSPEVPSNACNQGFSIVWPANYSTVFITASGNCPQIDGGVCTVSIDGKETEYASTTLGRASVETSSTTNNSIPLSVLVQAYDSSGTPLCLPTYGRYDAVFFN